MLGLTTTIAQFLDCQLGVRDGARGPAHNGEALFRKLQLIVRLQTLNATSVLVTDRKRIRPFRCGAVDNPRTRAAKLCSTTEWSPDAMRQSMAIETSSIRVGRCYLTHSRSVSVVARSLGVDERSIESKTE